MRPDEIDPRVEAHEWRFEAYHEALAPILPAIKAFCSAALRFDRPRWLSLLGPSGVGKTLILGQAYKFLARNWNRTEVVNGKTLVSWVPWRKWVIPARDLEDYRAPRDLAGFDLIYVEDIGAGADIGKGSGSVLRSRIAELLQLRTGKWTLLDANLYREQLESSFDGRLASRLKRDGSVCIEIPSEVPDFNG